MYQIESMGEEIVQDKAKALINAFFFNLYFWKSKDSYLAKGYETTV